MFQLSAIVKRKKNDNYVKIINLSLNLLVMIF